jgi:integrase
MILTFLNTGLRLGELVNLQWADIDFRRRLLKVQRKADWTPKAGERQIPLTPEMAKCLRDFRPPKAQKTDYVFSRRDNERFSGSLRKVFARIARYAGLEDVTKIHTLRHTFASHLVMSGVDLPTVQRLLGHSDIQTTMVYSHLAPEHLAGAVSRLPFGQGL